MRNINESQVRAYLLTHGVIEGLKLEGITLEEISRHYNHVESFVSILIQYGATLSDTIDKVEAELGEHDSDINCSLCGSVAPAWLVASLMHESNPELNLCGSDEWAKYTDGLVRAYYDEKLFQFVAEIEHSLAYTEQRLKPEPVYSEEAIQYHLHKFRLRHDAQVILDKLDNLKSGATHFDFWTLKFLKSEGASIYIEHMTPSNEEVWSRVLNKQVQNFEYMVPLRDLEKREILGSNQEERELMDEHYQYGDKPFVSPELANNSFTVNEKLAMPDSPELKADRELSKAKIANVHDITVIEIDGAVITVDGGDKSVKIVSKYCDLLIDEKFSVSGSVSNL